MNRKDLLIALVIVLALALVLGTVWVRQEGWVWTPAPTHWWWHALTAFILGVNVGQWIEGWGRRRKLGAIAREMRDATERMQRRRL